MGGIHRMHPWQKYGFFLLVDISYPRSNMMITGKKTTLINMKL